MSFLIEPARQQAFRQMVFCVESTSNRTGELFFMKNCVQIAVCRTWVGFNTKTGRFAVVTNCGGRVDAQSRGVLVSRFLNGSGPLT